MEKDYKKYWFFGSKLNTVLLLILIILMVIALKWMSEDKAKYFPSTPSIYQEELKQIEGDSKNLVSFSIKPGAEVSSKVHVVGSVSGGYFFEANILVNILDGGKKLLKAGNATATGEWMISGPVSFATDLDFTTLPKGPAYIEIHNDNASGLSKNDKVILIPVVIK